MSTIGTLNVENSIRWTTYTTESYLDSTIQYRSIFSDELSSGSNLNKTYFSLGSIPSGQTLLFDMFNLTGSGISTPVNFSGGNMILFCLENTSTGISSVDNITLYGTGANGLIQPFESGYLGTTVYPSSYKIFYNPNSGYGFPITTTGQYFYIKAGTPFSGFSNYRLTIAGYA